MRRALPARFDGQADVLPGTRVFVRHSPFHWGKSYWCETLSGDVLAVISQAMLERDLEREVTMTMTAHRETSVESEALSILGDVAGEVTLVGLRLPGNLTESQYRELFSRLLRLGRGCPWWIGDAICYGERRWGSIIGQWVDITGYDVGSLYNLSSVARRVEISRRREDLAWSHHAEVAALEPQEQTAWLEKARRFAWSCRDMREHIKAYREEQAAALSPAAPQANTPDVDAWMGEAKPLPEPAAERPDTSGLLRAMEPRPEPDESDYDVVEPREKIPEPPLSWQERVLFHLDVAIQALYAALDAYPDEIEDAPKTAARLSDALEEIEAVQEAIKESAMVVENNEEVYQPGQRVWIQIESEEWVTGKIVQAFGSQGPHITARDDDPERLRWNTLSELRPFREEDRLFSEALPLAATNGAAA